MTIFRGDWHGKVGEIDPHWPRKNWDLIWPEKRERSATTWDFSCTHVEFIWKKCGQLVRFGFEGSSWQKRLQALSLLCPHPKFHPGSKSAGHLVFKLPGLVNVYVTMENHHAFSGSIHYFYGQRPFSVSIRTCIGDWQYELVSGYLRFQDGAPRAPGPQFGIAFSWCK